jgi:hypothetical protein
MLALDLCFSVGQTTYFFHNITPGRATTSALPLHTHTPAREYIFHAIPLLDPGIEPLWAASQQRASGTTEPDGCVHYGKLKVC